MKRIPYPLLMGLMAWIIIYGLRKNGIIIPVINNYFTDFITIPMYCFSVCYIMNEILGFQWKPDLSFYISSFIYISILFEIICPLFSDRFTRDIGDVLAYFSGGLIHYLKYHFKNHEVQ
jgi:prepilin signal peptidase PulO-like enzyme (type II secretory pathway)